jgi:hypothetical protein
MMDESAKITRAKQELELYQKTLVEILGPDYKDDPAYINAVEQVAQAQAPFLVLCDMREIKKKRV